MDQKRLNYDPRSSGGAGLEEEELTLEQQLEASH